MAESSRLESVFRRSLELPQDTNVESLEYRQIMQWDSIGHMALVAEIESEFGVMFSTDQVLALSSFSKAKELLVEQGVTDF